MVFLSLVYLARSKANPGPDKWWRIQEILRMSKYFRNRNRNCYTIAYRHVHKALKYSVIARKVRKEEVKKLWRLRITAAADEHGSSYAEFMEGLARSNILLDRKTLNDLAITEPRTFKSLVEISKRKVEEEGIGAAAKANDPPKYGVIRRDMLDQLQ